MKSEEKVIELQINKESELSVDRNERENLRCTVTNNIFNCVAAA